MSTYNIEAMRKKLNDTWAATIIDIADKDFQNTQFVGDILFPRVGYDKDVYEIGNDNQYVAPMGYTNRLESIPMNDKTSTLNRKTLTLPTKAKKDQLPIDKLKWVLMAETISAKQWAELKMSGAKILTNLYRELQLRNEIEVWHYLTYGKVFTQDGVQYANFVPYGIDQTDYGTGICFHSRENWISAGGTINASATVIQDFLDAVAAMTSGDYDAPTTVWMNTTTYNCIYGNTALNTQTLNMYNPIQLKGFLGQDIDWAKKGIKISTLTPVGLNLVILDSTYRAASDTATKVKFIPDYYVVLTPSVVGNRFVAPNIFNQNSDRWAITYGSSTITNSNDVPGMFFEVGETSFPIPSNYDMKSHYVMYVKHTA
jgi:hypothetical protein